MLFVTSKFSLSLINHLFARRENLHHTARVVTQQNVTQQNTI